MNNVLAKNMIRSARMNLLLSWSGERTGPLRQPVNGYQM